MRVGEPQPLQGDGSGWLLAAFVAVLTALAVPALAGCCALGNLAGAWRDAAGAPATVYIGAVADDPVEPVARDRLLDERAGRVVALLEGHPAVRSARLLPAEAGARLLDAWLPTPLLDAVPVPRMIEVVPVAEAAGLAELQDRIERAIPGTRVDWQGAGIKDAMALARWLGKVALAVVAAAGVAGVLGLGLAACHGLGRCRDSIALLRWLGATDRAIILAFCRPFLERTAVGSLVGWAGGAVLLAGVTYIGADAAAGLPKDLKLTWIDWMLTGLMPFGFCLSAVGVGAVTVATALLRIP